METKQEILQAISKIPLLSPSVSQLLAVTSDADFEMAKLISIIKHDAALTARVLQVVNSAAYSLPVPAGSVDQAVSMLGARLLVSIALSDSGDGLFGKPLDGYENGGIGIWRHDLFCAIAARRIGFCTRDDFNPDLAFTGGLLHDIGKTVVSRFLDGSCASLLSDIRQEKREDYLDGEKQLLGMDHTEVGYELAKHWRLPRELQDAIRYHHWPAASDEPSRQLCYAIHLGDMLTMMAGYGTGSDSLQYQLDMGYKAYFDLEEEKLDRIILESAEEFTELEAVMASVMDG
ncbi:MAG: HDOD domain-containing protein [Gammaproteobacteria bacterium]|nr:HDOD domain-containing protein [Gammaproteobacteria bacterium]